MMTEARHGSPDMFLDPDAVRRMLGPQLTHSGHDLADQLLEVLDITPETVDDDTIAQYAFNRIDNQAGATANRIHTEISASVVSGYPDAFALSGPVTPRSIIRTKGLPDSARPVLKHEWGEVIAQSGSNLREELDTDRRAETPIGHNIDIESMQTALPVVKQEISKRIETAIVTIQELLPQRRVRIAASKLLSIAGIEIDAMPMHMVGGGSSANLNRAFNELIILFTSLTQGPDLLIDGLAAHLRPKFEASIRGNMRHRYESIASIHANDVLPDLFQLVYDAATDEVEQLPHDADDTDFEVTVSTDVDRPDVPEIEDAEIASKVQRRELGTVISQFPWAPGRSVTISIATRDGIQVLYCEAMNDDTHKLSAKLRSSTRAFGTSIDELWARTINLQLASNHSLNGRSSFVRRVSNPDFSNLRINYAKTRGQGANRTYYIVMDGNRYRTIAKFVKSHGISSDTPLVVLVGETDKNSQQALYNCLGAEYQNTRASGY